MASSLQFAHLKMRRSWIERFAFVVLITLAPSASSGQSVSSFEHLALRINLGDELQVEDQSGVRTRGRVVRLTRDELVLQTDGIEKHFTSGTVREVGVRGHSLRKSALIGAGVFAVLGAAATCAHEGGGDCVGLGAVRAAPIGAGVGLGLGAVFSKMKSIYRAPLGGAVPQPLTASGGRPSLLENLGLWVNLGDQLEIEDQSGVKTIGRLTGLTPNEIVIHTFAGDRRFTRGTVRQIALRDRPLRTSVLIGAGVGAAAGAVAACIGPDRSECVDGPIMLGALGAGAGLAVGALIHRTTIVYPEASKATRISAWPVIARRAFGVRVCLDW